jgi:hypothetical protein
MIEHLSSAEYRNMLASNVSKKRRKYGNLHTWRCSNCNAPCETKPIADQVCLYCGTVKFIHFDSKGEARYWDSLIQLQRAGVISRVERQVSFSIVAHGESITEYIADFRFFDKDNVCHVVDFKGGKATQTKEFRLKKRLLKALYGIEIEIAEGRLL